MIFIPTCSQDATTDIVTGELDANNVFRFNIDKPDDFAWDFHRNGFLISYKVNKKEISEKSLTSFYPRKPMYFDYIDVPKFGCLENWRREETLELFKDFYRECQSRGLTTLIHSQNNTYGKLRQMLAAEKYFRVAPWHFFHGELPEDLMRGRWVVKSMTSTPIGEGKVFLVKEVDPSALDLSYPWFLQERIAGEEEVTVVYVDGKTYAANAPRDSFDGEDSRKSILINPTEWPRCPLSVAEESAIRGFMQETGYRFGRFDFIRKDGELWFLELNPNGQWAWLDEKNEHGLVTMVADAIKREDQEHRNRKIHAAPPR
ncbi:MAG: hypothetical protein IJ829_00585 [Kiritimatiellae bacterium]|nr:hypothetical protein [Kiritimatiellia bacterium]